MGRDLCVEVKARADGFRELYSWLNQRDVLIVKADRREPLVVVRLSLAAEIAKLGSAVRVRKENGINNKIQIGHEDELPHHFSGLLATPNDCRPGRDLLCGANRNCLPKARRIRVP